MTSYPHARPQMPVQLYLLSGLVVFGLAALWLAAFHAFLQVASGPQAFFAATLIEAGLVIESLALVKRPQLWYIWLAVAISLAVSGTYNYIQAALAAPGFNPWQLGTLALGPLSALAFVSLTLGYELAEYQRRLEKWQADRADWIEARRQEAEAREEREKAELAARLERIQDKERERQEAESLRRFQLEQEDRTWRRHQEELARKRQERRELAQESAQSQPAPAPPALVSLKCEKCGATSGKSGQPFRTQAALNAHQAHCPGSSQLIEPVGLAQNGTGH
ncbi:MAG: hypothetical protein KJ077_27415 [Anaerolineae bacterium]|nr:hypothetical protein [Anaerolineae bacterium]